MDEDGYWRFEILVEPKMVQIPIGAPRERIQQRNVDSSLGDMLMNDVEAHKRMMENMPRGVPKP